MKRILKVFFWIILIPIIYVVGALVHGTLTDFQPSEVIGLDVVQPQADAVVSDSTLSFVIWNVGYGGLGKESEFFYDSGGFLTSNGKMVRAPKEIVEKNINGAVSYLKSRDSVDFFLLQEVDVASKRSYKINQYQKYQKALPKFSSTFAVNYRAPRVPLPVLEPWNVMGKMESGLGTFSKYTPTQSTRYQLPGEYPWPDRIFHLDRCAAFQRHPTIDGKELIVVNVHNSAYDAGGKLKKPQMEYLADKLKAEYAKGNYLVVGGDWNQRPNGADASAFGGKELENTEGLVVPADYFPDWQWAYDADTPTNRSLATPYQTNRNTVNLIDFFLVSPNLKIRRVETLDMGFQYSDHQPVQVDVTLPFTKKEASTGTGE